MRNKLRRRASDRSLARSCRDRLSIRTDTRELCYSLQINIGTIGHVAHGKSTVVKAISGVQTVRFKNELERNITIKLGYANAKVGCHVPQCTNDVVPLNSSFAWAHYRSSNATTKLALDLATTSRTALQLLPTLLVNVLDVEVLCTLRGELAC